ncbi:MAG: hypothetical protein NDI61_05305 [Bdellovibrionaceae bacterium]|nr:hypothetical protein [Pseudobdellovibrionaceae bacterium]
MSKRRNQWKYKWITGGVLAWCVLVALFQNCSQVVAFRSSIGLGTGQASADSGNGSGYDGKPSGTYYRFIPEFSCENQAAPKAEITIQDGLPVNYQENSRFRCGFVNGVPNVSDVVVSKLQDQVVSYRAIPFERKDARPSDVPGNLVEAWCRDLRSEAGYEIVSYFDRVQSLAVGRIYEGRLRDGRLFVTQGPDQAVSRLVSQERVILRRDDFELVIHRKRLSLLAPGEFIGELKSAVHGDRELSCALGGALDIDVWPVAKVFDLPSSGFQLSPDRQVVAVSSSKARLDPSVFTPSNPTTLFTRSGEEWRALDNLSTGLWGVSNFEFTTDSRQLVVVADPVPYVADQLIRIDVDGRQALLLNEKSVSEGQRVARQFQMSADGQYVYYRDGSQEVPQSSVYDIEKWLRRVPITGGPVELLHPVWDIAEKEVMEFHLLEHANAIFYHQSFGGGDRFFTANRDGSEAVELPLADLRPGWSFRPDRTRKLGTFVLLDYVRTSDMKFETSAFDVSDRQIYSLGEVTGFLGASPNGDWFHLRGSVGEWLLHPHSQVRILLAGYQQIQFRSDNRGMFGIQQDALATDRTKLMSLDFTTATHRELCPNQPGRWLAVKPALPHSATEWIALSQGANGEIFVYRAADTSCVKVNSFPATSDKFLRFEVSPVDPRFIVVEFGASGAEPESLVFVPLNGTPSVLITSPRHSKASIFAFDFTANGREILFYGDQDWPGRAEIFRWMAPSLD